MLSNSLDLDADSDFWPDPDSMNMDPKHCSYAASIFLLTPHRRVLVGHRAAVNVVDFDDKYIVSASGDRTIKVQL